MHPTAKQDRARMSILCQTKGLIAHSYCEKFCVNISYCSIFIGLKPPKCSLRYARDFYLYRHLATFLSIAKCLRNPQSCCFSYLTILVVLYNRLLVYVACKNIFSLFCLCHEARYIKGKIRQKINVCEIISFCNILCRISKENIIW